DEGVAVPYAPVDVPLRRDARGAGRKRRGAVRGDPVGRGAGRGPAQVRARRGGARARGPRRSADDRTHRADALTRYARDSPHFDGDVELSWPCQARATPGCASPEAFRRRTGMSIGTRAR